MVVYHCSAGRIKGAKNNGKFMAVSADAEKPANGRYRSSKVKDGKNK